MPSAGSRRSAVWLDSGGVSRRHAPSRSTGGEATTRRRRQQERDDASTAPPVAAPVTLRDGDRLVIGAVPLTYRTSAAAPLHRDARQCDWDPAGVRPVRRMTLVPGARFGPYEVLGPLGSGGMGEVYRARDTRLSRDAALKILPADVRLDARRVARFEREARTLATLSHANIATLYSASRSPAALQALAMEFVDGQTLGDHLARPDRAGRPAAAPRPCRSRRRLPWRSTRRTSTASSIAT